MGEPRPLWRRPGPRALVPCLLSQGKAIRRVPNPWAQDQLPSMELEAPSRGGPEARAGLPGAPPGDLGAGGTRMVVGGPWWTRVPFYVCAKNKRGERGGWNFKSTCALRRPNPGGPGKGSGAPPFPYGFFLLMPSPYTIEFNSLI